jgi:hypothetical protein
MIPIEISKDRDQAKKQMRGIANEVRKIILIRQAEYDKYGLEYNSYSILNETPYADRIERKNGKIITPGGLFVWDYVARVGSTPATITEDKGF